MTDDDSPACEGHCAPDLAVYHARCPLHGAALWSLVLDIEASNATERAETPAAPGTGGGEG